MDELQVTYAYGPCISSFKQAILSFFEKFQNISERPKGAKNPVVSVDLCSIACSGADIAVLAY